MRSGGLFLLFALAFACGKARSGVTGSTGAGGDAGAGGAGVGGKAAAGAGVGGAGVAGASGGSSNAGVGGQSSEGGSSGASAGTSGSSGKGGAPGQAVPVEELGNELADALCAWSDACGAVVGTNLPRGGCVESVSKDYRNQIGAVIAEGLAAGTIRYDPEGMRACLDARAELDCAATVPVDPFGCEDAVDGLVPTDSACVHDLECEGDSFCDTASGCPGVCTPRGGFAAPCAGGNTACTSGYRCNVLGLDGLGECSELAGEGEECGSCREGLTCNRSLGSVCVRRTRAGLGEACENPLVLCAEGSCTHSGEVGDDGEALYACTAPAESGGECRRALPEMCPYDEACAAPPVDANDAGVSEVGTCVPRGSDGDPCEEGSGFSLCVYGAYCRDGICRERRDNGESCETQDDCFSRRCLDGTCAAPACDP